MIKFWNGTQPPTPSLAIMHSGKGLFALTEEYIIFLGREQLGTFPFPQTPAEPHFLQIMLCIIHKK